MTAFFKIDSANQIAERLEHLGNYLRSFWNFDQHSVMVEYKAYSDPRSRSQNGLYWMWMGEMAHYFSKGQEFSQEDMHDLMRHQFLGYEDKVVGSTRIGGQLRSTTKLTKLEMSEYMAQIEAWCVDKGLRLTIPHTNEYFKYREASQ